MNGLLDGGDEILDAAREPDRNDRLIPMINIVFLLLTFFLIAGTFHAAEVFDIEPPEATGETVAEEDGPVLLVSREGRLAIGGKVVETEDAIARLKAMGDPAREEVRIKADRGARARVILPLLKALADAGITRVRLIAVQRQE
jgi:biopolymer transport protein ExbD